MAPIPSGVLHAVTSYLKWGSSNVVGLLFTATGTPYHQDGFVFALPTFVIEIADECSGIRSSISLLLTSLLAGHLLLENAWTKTVLATAVLPLAIIKNGIRIVSLSLLAMHVDPGFLAGSLHHEGGIVFYLLTLMLLAPLLGILRRSELTRSI
jgi:exosortase